jgi:hypothetical protein
MAFIVGNTFAQNLREGLSVLGSAEPVIDQNIFQGEIIAIECSSIADAGPAVGNPRVGTNVFWKNQANFKRPAALPSSQISTNGTVLEIDPQLLAKPIGASAPLTETSPWPLQPYEVAIIPDGPGRDYQLWKKPL